MRIRELFWPILGNWAGPEEQSASPWAPAATTRAMLTLKLDVSDTVVVQDYRQVRADGSEFTGHGVFLLKPDSPQVLWWFFDSYGEPPTPAEGGWETGDLTVTKRTPPGAARHRFSVRDDELRYAVETRLGEATAFSPFLTGTYRRISGH